MHTLRLSAFVILLLLGVSACSSVPSAPAECPPRPAPPAWMMQPAPDLLTPLNGIISVSESESKPQQDK